MRHPLSVLAILMASAMLTPAAVKADNFPSAISQMSGQISGMSELSAAKQKHAGKQAPGKRDASKQRASKRHASKRYDRTSQPAWRPGVFRSDPSFDPYGRPWRPNFYSKCYEDLGYGRFRSCDVF